MLMQQPNVPNTPGSGEPDTGPAPMQTPQAGSTATMAPNPQMMNSPGSGEPDTGPAPQGQPNAQDAQVVNSLKQQLQGLSPEDQQFFAQHMTPEVVKVIGLINGPVVAGYLGQFADTSKVLVPVPREVAGQLLAKMKAQGGQQQAQPQGQSQPMPTPATQPSPPAAPVGGAPRSGMMAPQ